MPVHPDKMFRLEAIRNESKKWGDIIDLIQEIFPEALITCHSTELLAYLHAEAEAEIEKLFKVFIELLQTKRLSSFQLQAPVDNSEEDNLSTE